jgi:hypothetical protein
VKLIFLNIDGVLNSMAWFKGHEHDRGLGHLNPTACARAQRICDVTGAVLVISSTWRLLHKMADLGKMLTTRGLTARVVGRTPASRVDERRGHEIQRWLDTADVARRTPPTGMVILDDDSDMFHLTPWLVKTPFETGLTDYYADKAIEMLGRPMPAAQPTSEEGSDG